MVKNSYFKYLLIAVLFGFSFFSLLYFVFDISKRDQVQRLQYVTGFTDGLKACKAKLDGMSTEEVINRYYKYEREYKHNENSQE